MLQQLATHMRDDCLLFRKLTVEWIVGESLATDGYQQRQEGKQLLEI